MKNIDPRALTVKKMVCPLCSFGCDFGIVLNDFGIKGVEYTSGGSSDGRLCPRGSAAAMYMDHPRRLSAPLKKGGAVAWSKIGKELSKIVGNPKSVAVTVDRNVTSEEYLKILGFCKKMAIEDVASSYFEPDYYLRKFLGDDFSISEIAKADSILIIGDPFNYAPMSSRAIIDWKLKDRARELIVVDSVNTHTAGFASKFLKVRVGTEPLALLELAQQKCGGLDIAGITGIDAAMMKEVSGTLKSSRNGIIFVCVSFAHTCDPLLLAEAIMHLREFSGMSVVPFVEFAAYDLPQNFAAIVAKVKEKKIKYVINFGELFPFYYPQLSGDLRAATIYATSPLKFSDHNVLPVPLTLEKDGTVLTTFGKKKLAGSIDPPSGAKSIDEILGMLSDERAGTKPTASAGPKIDVSARAKNLAERVVPKKKGMRLIGEKIAYSFLGFFEPEALKINPADALELGIKAHDTAVVTSKHGSVDLAVKLTEDVDQGIAAVAAETPAVKGLFSYEFDPDTHSVNFVPTEVKICRKE